MSYQGMVFYEILIKYFNWTIGEGKIHSLVEKA
jgi:hypothetical protein